MSEKSKIPNCVGIILDGNRRWAKSKGLPKLEGHRVGLLTTLKNTVKFVRDLDIKHLAVFMFSTENWNREPVEVSYLMNLFRESIKKEIDELGKEGVRVRFIGQRQRFSSDLQKSMNDAERDTANNSAITLWACMSYGGRAEIIEATKKMNKEYFFERTIKDAGISRERDFWYYRCYQAEVEWVCNVVSAVLVNEGGKSLFAHLPTARGWIKANEILKRSEIKL